MIKRFTRQLLTVVVLFILSQQSYAQCFLAPVLFGQQPSSDEVCVGRPAGVLNYTLTNFEPGVTYTFRLFRNGVMVREQVSSAGLSFPLPAMHVSETGVDTYICSVNAVKVCGGGQTDSFSRQSNTIEIRYILSPTVTSFTSDKTSVCLSGDKDITFDAVFDVSNVTYEYNVKLYAEWPGSFGSPYLIADLGETATPSYTLEMTSFFEGADIYFQFQRGINSMLCNAIVKTPVISVSTTNNAPVLFSALPNYTICYGSSDITINTPSSGSYQNSVESYRLFRGRPENANNTLLSTTLPYELTNVSPTEVNEFFIEATNGCGSTNSNVFTVNFDDIAYNRTSPDTIEFCTQNDLPQVDYSINVTSHQWRRFVNGNVVQTYALNSPPIIQHEAMYVLSATNACGTFNVDTIYSRISSSFCSIGQSLNFNSHTDGVNVNNFNAGSSNEFTFECWLRLNSSASAPVDYAGIMVVRPSATGMIIRRSNGIRLGVLVENQYFNFVGGPVLENNKWCHVALVIKQDSVILYKDGVATTVSTDSRTAFTLSNQLRIGHDEVATTVDGRRRFFGDLDEIRVWNKALTATEISNIVENKCPISADSEGLITYFDCNQGVANQDNTSIPFLENLANTSVNGTFLLARTTTTSNFTHRSPIKTTLRNPSITLASTGDVITSSVNNTFHDVTYQWFSCFNDQAIDGETNATLSLSTIASFGMIATSNGCPLPSLECVSAGLNISFIASDSIACVSDNSEFTFGVNFDPSGISFPYEVRLLAKAPDVSEPTVLHNFGQTNQAAVALNATSDLNNLEVYIELRNTQGAEVVQSRKIPLIVLEGPQQSGNVSLDNYSFCTSTASTITIDYPTGLFDVVDANSVKLMKGAPGSVEAQVITDVFPYTITNPTANDAGTYFFEATNNCGVGFSSVFYINQYCNEGRSANFTLTTDLIQIDSPDFNYTVSDVTIECWMRLTDLVGDYTGIVTSRPVHAGLILRRTGAGNNVYRLGSLFEFGFTGGPVISQNTWHHVALVKNGGNVHLYLDGQATQVTASAPATLAFTTFLSIGRETGAVDRNFKGDIDDVRFWTRALSEQEVQHHYMSKCPVSVDDEDLKVYFDFNVGTANGNNSSITTLQNIALPDFTASVNLSRNGISSNFTERSPMNSDIKNPVIEMDNDNEVVTSTVYPSYASVFYQWYDCVDNEDIIGENNASFDFINEFNVGLRIENNGCSLPSVNCVGNVTVNTQNYFEEKETLFFPNPSNDVIYTKSEVAIMDLLGNVLLTGKGEIYVGNLSDGIYIVKSDDKIGKMIKK